MRRVVLFKLKADADAAEFVASLETLQTLDERILEMKTWSLEICVGREGLWDACLIADFDDFEALHRYENHPEHVAAGGAVAAVSDFAVFDSEA